MSEQPMAESAALAIMRVLPRFPNAMREENIHQLIVGRDDWESADVTNGLAYAEKRGWITRNHGRVSATKVGIEPSNAPKLDNEEAPSRDRSLSLPTRRPQRFSTGCYPPRNNHPPLQRAHRRVLKEARECERPAIRSAAPQINSSGPPALIRVITYTISMTEAGLLLSPDAGGPPISHPSGRRRPRLE
jgi:hypothetical protein